MDYRTVAGPAQDQFEEKRSRFIGAVAPVATEEEALAFVAARRRAHPEARHHVYAFVLRQGGLQRFSDDGEPSGTGGRPVLDVLAGSGLVDAVVVVTRYFGGTLLGTGGLVRAYSQGARLALAAAAPVVMTHCTRLCLTMDYGFYGKVAYLLPQLRVVTVDTRFTDLVELELLVAQDQLAPFLAQVGELSGAQISPQVLEELFAPFPPGE